MLAPTYDEQAEKALLGATIMDDTQFEIARARVVADDFFALTHALIWGAMESIRARQHKIDFVTVQAELDRGGHLDEVGGLAYLTQLISHYNQVDHIDGYVDSVVEMATRRRMMTGAAKLLQEAQNLGNELPDLMGQWDAVSVEMHQRNGGRQKSFEQLISNQFDKITERMQNPNAMIGIPSGFVDLDNMTRGFTPGQLLILAGRPGMGKSALMLAVLLMMAKAGLRVGIFSLEMTAESLMNRFAAMETGIPVQRLLSGQISPQEYQRFIQAQSGFYKFKDRIFVDDTFDISAKGIKAKALQWQMEMGLDFIAVDYLQLMTDKTEAQRKDGTREREVANITRQLKGTAKDLGIPILALAQLNRGVEGRQDKRPMLADLRESGSIEQDADMVMFLYREAYYEAATDEANQAELIIAKHREGPTGTVSLYFDKETASYKNGVRREVDFGGYNAG